MTRRPQEEQYPTSIMTYIDINNYIIYKIINIYFQPITTFLFIYFKRKPIIIFQQLLLTQVAFKEQIFMPIGFTRHTVLVLVLRRPLPYPKETFNLAASFEPISYKVGPQKFLTNGSTTYV